MTRVAILLALILVPAALATADGEFQDIRSEITAVRTELTGWTLSSPRAATTAQEAADWLTQAVGTIDEGDEDRLARVFVFLAKAMRRMKKAARQEGSVTFDVFVEESCVAFWGRTSVLFAPENPAIPDPDPSRLEKRLARRLWRAGRSAGRENWPQAVRRLRSAWKVHLRIQRLP